MIKKIFLEVYPFNLFICVSSKSSDVRQLLLKKGYDFTEEEFEDWTSCEADRAMTRMLEERPFDESLEEDAPTGFVLWVQRIPRTNRHIGELCHEIDHIVNYVFTHAGVEANYSDDEHHAYLVEFITEKVLNALRPDLKHPRRSM